MKKIYPDSIPELKIMPYLIGILIAGAFAIFFTKKKWLFIGWALFFVAIGVYGMYDFYTWEYDYGHNLDPHAAIKVPGMNYQPPLLGMKQLLNFKAYSLPDIGGFLIMGSAILAFLLVLVEMKNVFSFSRKKKPSEIKINSENKTSKNFFGKNVKTIATTVLLLTVFLGSCTVEQQPIQYGKDVCAFCKMTITDSRFGCELLTKKGKAFKFDSNECMINYISENKIEESSINSFLTTDYSSPGKLIDAKNSFFIVHSDIQSPMGGSIVAFTEKTSAQKYDTAILNWVQILQHVSSKN
jgi:copper chaperone NosL